MLVGRANLQKGETVFIWGASGGLGSSAIQIAKYLGARIIAAAKSEEDARQIREIGADEIVIYTKGNVESEVKNLTNGLGVDVVFESVGEKTWSTTLAMLRPFGRVVIAGTTSGDMGTQDLSDIYVRQLSIFGARMGTKEEFEKVLELVAAGKLKPIIDKTFPLKDAAKAQERMVKGEHFGKIMLEIQ
jgi:NADPH:quinone reductase-like Zn-dependent oxidoreductase